MEPVVLFGTPSDGLLVCDVRRDEAEPRSAEALIELRTAGLCAAVFAWDHLGFTDLSDFLSELERDWLGWDGAREWASTESNLSIACRHDGAHVTAQIRLTAGSERWIATTSFTFGPGEDLSRAQRTAEALFSWPGLGAD